MYEPHFRLTWSGTLPNGEVFACRVALVPDNSAWAAAVNAVAKVALLTNALTDVNLTDDLVTDVSNYHSREGTHLVSTARLKRVTLAAIDENGHYAAAPREAAMDVGGYHSGNVSQFPHQIARKVTLETDGDLGRVKGGWYLPLPANDGWDPTTNLWSVANTEAVRDSTRQFCDDLQNAPGLDANSFLVAVASAGRHNRDGSVRLGPQNHLVKRVNIGRRVDVQRRRSNKISEARLPDASLA